MANVKISTTLGDIIVKLYDETPLHRDNFLKLAKEGYYDGTIFHRVIKNFMVQGGDPDSRNPQPNAQYGTGGPDYTIEAEIKPTLFHKRGALAAARTGDEVNPERRSSGSQFYIVWGDVYKESQMAQLSKQMEMMAQQNIFNRLATENKAKIMDLRRNRDREGELITLSRRTSERRNSRALSRVDRDIDRRERVDRDLPRDAVERPAVPALGVAGELPADGREKRPVRKPRGVREHAVHELVALDLRFAEPGVAALGRSVVPEDVALHLAVLEDRRESDARAASLHGQLLHDGRHRTLVLELPLGHAPLHHRNRLDGVVALERKLPGREASAAEFDLFAVAQGGAERLAVRQRRGVRRELLPRLS